MPTPLPSSAPHTSSLDLLAGWLRAAGDPLRLLILRILARDSFGVLELCQLLDMKQPALSHHLKVLLQADLVTTRRERTTVFYRRNQADREAGGLKALLFAQVDAESLPDDVSTRLLDVQELRSQASQRFFAENAARFQQQQELIAGFAEYGPDTALRAASLGHATVLEIGPGEGALLPLLSSRFKRVLALDNSSEMLAKAEATVRQHRLGNVELLLGDTRRQGLRELKPDVVVMNMVLHHVPAPAQLLADAASLLPGGGALVISELCEHEQDWAREACGDVWLGLSPEALGQWAATAGLQEGRADYLALKNGFRIQIREFMKPLH